MLAGKSLRLQLYMHSVQAMRMRIVHIVQHMFITEKNAQRP